jgi:hypothetical protein
VAVGPTGTILQSDPVVGPQLGLSLSSTGEPQLRINGWIGSKYFLQGSSDLKNWTNVMNLSLTNATETWVGPARSSLGSQFYRAVAQ